MEETKIKFKCDEILNNYDYENSPWGENRNFVYNLVKNKKPKKIVELGSYLGCSTFAIAQSLKDNNIFGRIYAIDTWGGDQHSGFYDDLIFDNFCKVVSKEYLEHVFVLRGLFDSFVENFEDDSIDLLHIDGLHTYEAVQHDFETWFPKVKHKTGIILMHDINVELEGFGVKKFWEEICVKNFKTEKINNKNGLGVIYV